MAVRKWNKNASEQEVNWRTAIVVIGITRVPNEKKDRQREHGTCDIYSNSPRLALRAVLAMRAIIDSLHFVSSRFHHQTAAAAAAAAAATAAADKAR